MSIQLRVNELGLSDISVEIYYYYDTEKGVSTHIFRCRAGGVDILPIIEGGLGQLRAILDTNLLEERARELQNIIPAQTSKKAARNNRKK